MIVYSTVLKVARGSEPGFRRAIFEWLTTKHHTPTLGGVRAAEELTSGAGGRIGQSPAWLDVLDDRGGESPDWRTLGVRYRHPDSQDANRSWVTVAGYRRGLPETDDVITVELRVEEMSPLVRTKFEPSRPNLIDLLLRHCAPSPATPGLKVRDLKTPEDVGRWAEGLHSMNRRVPYVLVSPTEQWTGRYLADADVLQHLLLGVAEVARIPIEADQFLVTDKIGKPYSAWWGAVAFYLPPSARWSSQRGTLFPVKRFLREELEREEKPEANLIFPHVLHWANWHAADSVIRWEALTDIAARARLTAARARIAQEGAGDQAELLKLFEKEVERQSLDLEVLRKAHDAAAEERDLARLELEEKTAEVEFQKSAFIQMQEQMTREAPRVELTAELAEAVLAFAGGRANLTSALALVAAARPNRVEILESAWRSAREADTLEPRVVRHATDLLLTLSGPYWEQLREGKGDAGARGLFGDSYAARESETVATNRRARDLRTFNYSGESVRMESHLRVGVKDSIATTWRCHFLWDSVRQRIVIGHCGKHLDFR
ncbi:MAG: hypothetical protein F9K16_00160 [Thermoanaerobaculia bacterium]|nr:MAG: hypothetical protein F9K16_00160 [Thermoanaerobaculia bacterium]MBZ0103432.1 hypothetical protein [Thermoanaerobaculia bacterium]